MRTRSADYCMPEKSLVPNPVKEKRRKHFKHSHTARIHNNLEVEIIFRPYKKLILYEEYMRLKESLWKVLLLSCQKTEKEAAEYKNHIDIEKVAIDVDYLIIVKDKAGYVGFSSGTFIDSKLFYVNCAMMLPGYQLGGIGAIMTAVLCSQVIEYNNFLKKESPDFICRTQNKKAANTILRAMENGIISTESSLTEDNKSKILQTARYLNCVFDIKSGVSQDVYPGNLPKGNYIKDGRINKAFEKIGPRDGCYVLGKINEKLIGYLVKKYVNIYSCKTAVEKEVVNF